MVAVEIVGNRSNKLPKKEKTAEIILYANVLLQLSAGLKGNVIRFLAPLVNTDKAVLIGLSILEAAFN